MNFVNKTEIKSWLSI